MALSCVVFVSSDKIRFNFALTEASDFCSIGCIFPLRFRLLRHVDDQFIVAYIV